MISEKRLKELIETYIDEAGFVREEFANDNLSALKELQSLRKIDIEYTLKYAEEAGGHDNKL